MSDQQTQDAGSRGIRPASARPPPATHGRPRPDEAHRAATPLELLFDLTSSSPSARAAAQTAHLLELGPRGCRRSSASCSRSSRSGGRGSTTRGSRRHTTTTTSSSAWPRWWRCSACWSWPWACRLFHSLDEGEHVDNGVVVAGYVVMRVATIALWLRAAKHDRARRRTRSRTSSRRHRAGRLGRRSSIVNLPSCRRSRHGGAHRARARRAVLAEPQGGTPWHAHHIAERYGCS